MNTRLLRIRRLLCGGCLLVASACCLPPAATADDASKTAIINELFTVMHQDTVMQQSLRQGINAQRAQFEKIEPFKSNKAALDEVLDRMTKLLADKISWDKLKPAMTKLYADNFTEAELSASLAFYKTPAGQAMVTKLPVVMAGSMTIAQQQMGDLTPEIQRMMQEIMAKYPSKPKTAPGNG